MIYSMEREKLNARTYIFQGIENKKFSHQDTIDIMMIDDNQRDIDLFEEIVKSECTFTMHFTPYTNPVKALEALENKKTTPDLIVLDLVMPIINGKMVLRRLKNIITTQNIPVVIHSSSHNYENVIRVIELDAHAFFEKPINGEIFNKFIMQ